MNYLSQTTVEMLWEIPLSELILDFFDKLKSNTKGYASLDYEMDGYKPSQLVKLDILLSGKPIDALSFIVHKDKAYDRGRVLCDKLKEIIPRQMFEVPIQAAIGGRVHRAPDREGQAQGRARQVLRRRHHPQAQASGEAEGRQEAHEGHRQRGSAPGGLHGHFEGG